MPSTIFACDVQKKIWQRIAETHNMYYVPSEDKRAQLIYGASGAGKTYILKQYHAQFIPVTTPEKTTVPVFYVAFKEFKKSTAEITRFLISELDGTTQNARASAAELDSQLVTLLKGLEVELIILDEIQNIASSYDGIEFQRIIKYFCYLIDSNKIRCSIVLQAQVVLSALLHLVGLPVNLTMTSRCLADKCAPLKLTQSFLKRKTGLPVVIGSFNKLDCQS